MRIEEETVVIKRWISDVVPEVTTGSKALANAMRWADENPKVWKIVMTNKSRVFRPSSTLYPAYARGDDTDAILYRVSKLRTEMETRSDFWGKRAYYTFEHFGEKGFRGGEFRLWNGEYFRNTADHDYTMDTLSEVVENFREWCEASSYPVVAIYLDDEIVWHASIEVAARSETMKERHDG